MRNVPRSIVLALVAIVASWIAGTGSAIAQGFWSQGPFGWSSASGYIKQRPAERSRRTETSRERVAVGRPRNPSVRSDADEENAPAPAKSSPHSALVAVVSIRNQSITVWDHSGPVLRSRVSTGQPGHETPTGLFSVIQKNRHHESNIYSGAPMPWMHRITWSGIALHAGQVPNHPASHGCIRLPYDVAPKVWGMSRIGMRVVVAPDDAPLQMVLHDALPQPRFLTAAEAEAALRGVRGEAGEAARLMLASASAAPERQIGPLEFAQLLKRETAAQVELRKRAAREALAQAAQISADAHAAAAMWRDAKAAVASAEAAARDLADGRAAKSDADRSAEEQAAARAADDRLRDAHAHLKAAATEHAEKDRAAFAAARAAREAEVAAEEAPSIAREAAKRLEPISILVSAKEERVFIRQGFEPVLDARVEIVEPLDPLGTHVFTAMAPLEGGKRLAWSAVTMPGGRHSGDAVTALERIVLPDAVRDEIARRVATGASLIITDEGISNETGRGTDFVILTK